MGQCMSRKAAGAFAASAAAAHSKPTKMHRNGQVQSPGGDEERNLPKKSSSQYRGAAMSFGFRRRPTTAPSIASNSNAARRLANSDTVDTNGNGDADTEPLTKCVAATGRSTPKLMPPKKEAAATKISRFGFRNPHANRMHKVADLNGPLDKAKIQNATNQLKFGSVTVDSNKNRIGRMGGNGQQAEKLILQSTQLPRPEPVRVIVTKTAKTLANNSKRNAYHEDKDGFLTEDSGIGSQISGGIGDFDRIPGVERLNHSPTYGSKRSFLKSRNLEMIVSGNKFDVRDLEDTTETCAPLPQLPSAYISASENLKGVYHNSGYVKDKAREYQRQLSGDNRRKISATSSEGFSDDYVEKESGLKDRARSVKTFLKPGVHRSLVKDDSSPPSSDEHDWVHGGEAMAEEVSFSLSSSDESKEKDQFSTIQTNITNMQKVLLTIEDPKFAAVATACSNSSMLQDETSPVDSLLSFTESEEILKKRITNNSSSNSKDVNEKLTPPSPGTPTNVSNSLSLSDGKDDFLIDDEIADQPALVFEDTLIGDAFNISQNNSDNTLTIDPTPKPKRRTLLGVEGSPLMLRKRRTFHNRTESADTLSPCESIASDDLMMDFDYSQSSGQEDVDKTEGQSLEFSSLEEFSLPKLDIENGGASLRDCPLLLRRRNEDRNVKSTVRTSRLLSSRTATPESVPDSPKPTARPRHLITSSPLRPSRAVSQSTGYDSDDSVRLDRANHAAIKQDIMHVKTMLLKLRRFLNEPVEDILLRSDTHIPFDGQVALTNGLFNGLCSSDDDAQAQEVSEDRLELAELRKQNLFLQGQLEDKERTLQEVQEQLIKLSTENYLSNSAPASTTATVENPKCNAATQTERVRSASTGHSMLNGTSTEGVGSLVSVSEPPQERNLRSAKKTPKLWRKPGEPPSPQRYSSTSRRANSRTRTLQS